MASETTFEAASLAAGTAIEAALHGGFALVRPPGITRCRDRAMGFCFFDNIAIAARVAQRELGLERVAIVDYDVHHGNGTDAIFRDDDSVLFVSLHQWPFYPGSGGPGRPGEDDLNIPLAAGSGDEEYFEAFERARRARGRAHSSRSSCSSPPASTPTSTTRSPRCSSPRTGFRELSRRCSALAPRCAAVLEGGYELATLPGLVAAALDGFDRLATAKRPFGGPFTAASSA